MHCVILFFALKNKKPGSKLIGSGFGFFALFILSFFVFVNFLWRNLKFDHVTIGSLVFNYLLLFMHYQHSFYNVNIPCLGIFGKQISLIKEIN